MWMIILIAALLCGHMPCAVRQLRLTQHPDVRLTLIHSAELDARTIASVLPNHLLASTHIREAAVIAQYQGSNNQPNQH
jgi:hypothetical protein